MTTSHKDIIIVGAGLSGIGAACHLSRKNPEKSYTILESRAELGGTWSLFKYPGIRSDSDMYTFGYSFKTWDNPKSFADAPSILEYLNEAAREYDVHDKIVYEQRVVSCDFNTTKNIWNITTEHPDTGEQSSFTCNLIFNCCGYYRYDQGYKPDFDGQSDFSGTVIHPQQWPSDLDYTDKKIVVIGSGATAVTLIPKLAEKAAKVTMLQRSPTYIGILPNKDVVGGIIKKLLPKKLAYRMIRFKNISFGMLFYNLCRKYPNAMKKSIIKNIKKNLGDFPIDPHFVPNYKPWAQRFCIAPDGDLFAAINDGKATVVTEHIDKFIENGILLKTGESLDADIIVTATGLQLLLFGGADASIDGELFNLPGSFIYKGTMLNDLPNFFVFAGYTNASWTLKSDLTSEYISRVMDHMDKHKYSRICAKLIGEQLQPSPLLDLDSGYINRSAGELPQQGHKVPWKLYQNYFYDYKMLRVNSVEDDRLAFS